MALDKAGYRLKNKTSGEFLVGDLTVPFVIKRSGRAKKRSTARLTSEAILIITMPKKASAEEVLAGFSRKKSWLKPLAERLSRQQTLHRDILEGEHILYQGTPVNLRFEEKSSPSGHYTDDTIFVNHTAGLARETLKKWLLEQSVKLIDESVRKHAGIMGVSVQRVTLRDQKTRWGSCSSKGSVNLNWRLVFAPQSVLDYVVIHELAHLVEMNHSERFWAVVEKYCPDHRKESLWLREHGHLLRAFN